MSLRYRAQTTVVSQLVEQAMRDLFKAEKIRMEAYGKSSLGRQRIALGR